MQAQSERLISALAERDWLESDIEVCTGIAQQHAVHLCWGRRLLKGPFCTAKQAAERTFCERPPRVCVSNFAEPLHCTQQNTLPKYTLSKVRLSLSKYI